MKKVIKGLIFTFLIILICTNSFIMNINSPRKAQNTVNQPATFAITASDYSILWNKTWGGTNEDRAYGVTLDPAGNSYWFGYTMSYGAGSRDYALLKYYPNGSRAWNVTWGGTNSETCWAVALDTMGNLYCAGETRSYGSGDWDYCLVKYYANSTFAWYKVWGGSYVDICRGVVLDSAGNIYLAGRTSSFGAGDFDFGLVKYYSNGTFAWYTTWGGALSDWCWQMTIDKSDNIYCTGFTSSFGAGNEDFALVKFYSNGTRAWNTTWGGAGIEESEGVVLDSAGNLFCAGWTQSFGAAGSNFALVKFYPNGTRAWNTTWGGNADDRCYDLALDTAGYIHCTGLTASFGAASNNFAEVTFDPNGLRVWNTTWGGSNTDEGMGTAVDSVGDIYCAGYTMSFGAGNWDFALVKISNSPPTYTSILETADPLELGYTEAITIAGVKDRSGIQTVRIMFEGSNHTMTDLGGGSWQYNAWKPGNVGTYFYTIYFQDKAGKWNMTSNSIQVVLTTVPESSDPTADEWPMFRGQLNHTGEAHTTPLNNDGPYWSYLTEGTVLSSAAVMGGRVYIGSSDSKIYCLNATSGALLWNYTTGAWVESSPAIAGGRVYAGSGDGKVYCLNAFTGGLIWNYTTGGGIHSSPAVAGGCVFVGSRDHNIYSLNATTGKLLWNYPTGWDVDSSPVVADGRVYASSWDWNVYCLNESTGGLLWNYPNTFSALVVADGMVYGGSYDGYIYCLFANTGSSQWNFPTGNIVESCPAVENGRVFVGSYDGNIYCINATSGGSLWSYSVGTGIYSSPAIVEDRVYVGTDGGIVYCLNGTTGNFLCSYETASSVQSSPAVACGRVYVGSGDGTIYCLPCIVNPKPPTYSSVEESADPLELGGTEIITITGVTAIFGVKQVLITFEGTNHSMTNLGGGSWQYSTWSPSTLNNYSYTIYIEELGGYWNVTAGMIHMVNQTIPTFGFVTESADPISIGSNEIITIFGVADPYGIGVVLLEFEGTNHTMNDLGNGTWGYSSWSPSDMGNYSYTLYIMDKSGICNATSGSIKVLLDNRSLLWIAQWGGPITEVGYGVISDPAGNSYCTGSTTSFGAGNDDFALVKFYPNGTRAWNTTWGGAKYDDAYGIARDTAGNLYLVGQTESFGAGSYDLALVKFYPNGTRAWNITWGTSGWEQARAVKIDTAGNLYCIGTSVGGYLLVVKFYPNGTQAWNTTWGGPDGQFGSDIVLDTVGNLYCIGSTYSFGAGTYDFALVKFYPNGTRAWNTTWGGPDWDLGQGIAIDSAGYLYCVGCQEFGGGMYSFVLLKFYPNGTLMWNTILGGYSGDIGNAIALDTQGNIYCGGCIDYDATVVIFYPNGTYALEITLGGYNSEINDLIFDAAGNLFCVGRWNLPGVNDELKLVKFGDPEPPIINVNTPNAGTYISAPIMDIDFSDSFSLNAGYYKVDSYIPTGTSTTNWTQIFENQAGNCYTTNFTMNTTLWDSLSQGLHVVYFKAWDDAGNINDGASPCWQFCKDSKAPIYLSIIESADPLEFGATETITITGVADISGIETVLLEFEGENHTMTNLGGVWFYNGWHPSSTGMSSYTIYIKDIPGNWNVTSGTIQVASSAPPSFISVLENADPLELGNPEMITIAGVADLSDINVVLLEFGGDNHTMTNLGGGTWQYSVWTPISVGDYPYQIFLEDTLGNWNRTSGTIQVIDTTPPTFVSVIESADPLELGGTEAIAIAGVADLSGIQTVQITFGGSNKTMANLGGGVWRYNIWTPNSTGIYPYEIFIQDNAGNWRGTGGLIQVNDITPPIYISIDESADPLEIGCTEMITISGIADLSGIQTVCIEFEGSNHTMTNLSNGTWQYSTWVPDSVGTHPYWIYIQDNASNWKATSGAIQVIGTTVPTYASVTESADPLQLGNPETILISGIMDMSGIQTVRITIEGSNHTMTNLGGGTWVYLGWTPSAIGTYSYTIYIQDNAGNWNAVSGSITVAATPAAPSQDWLIWLLALIAIGAVFCTIVLYMRLNKEIKKLSKPKAIPPKDLAKKPEN